MTEFDRVGWENIWRKVIAITKRAKRDPYVDLEPNILPSSPTKLSL